MVLNNKLIIKSIVCFCMITTTMSCRQGNKANNEAVTEDTIVKEKPKSQTFETLFDSNTNSIPIFYNMYLTVEMTSLFEETGVAFNHDLLNPADNMENYLTSYKKALNIGVYAVDLSYVKVFDEFDLAGKYFSSMHKLSESLGIPDDFFYGAAKRFEKNISNKDSLAFIANEVYTITDNYLKSNNRQNTAALIIVGGWIEAIHLALNIYEKTNNDISILDKIADQKNSLVQVVNLVKLGEDRNEYIVGILQDIKDLQKPFNDLSANYANPVKAKPYVHDLLQKVSAIRQDMIN